MRKLSLFTFILLLSACNPSLDQQVADLVNGKNKWLNYAAGRDYTYIYQRRCFCDYAGKDIRVTVKDNKVIAKSIDGKPVELKQPGSMRDQFNLILTLLQHQQTHQDIIVRAQYHPLHGYPTEISISEVKRAMDSGSRHLIKQVNFIDKADK